jgi:4-amino-4-deoxy-L-arabinose transferase-like glycosyltransferase
MMEASEHGAPARAAPRRAVVIVLTLLCAILYLPPAMTTPFFTKGEPREGLVVRRMLEHGDWILPKRTSEHGWTIASKPPFFHWLGALAARATGGPSELAIRLPSVALGTGAVLAVWLIARSLLPGFAALYGAVVLATTFEWVRAASSARVDAALAALMTGALLLFYRGAVRGGLSRLEAVAAYGLLVCATLTKGPVGFVLPALVLGVALLVTRDLALIPRFRPVLGTLMTATFVGGWYLAAWHLGGDPFFRKHILKENVFRFLGSSALKSGHEHGFFYYLPTFAAGFLPWTPFLVAALVAALRDRTARRDRPVTFLLVWTGVVFAFYSAASAKRSVYLLALYPAAALLTGWWWERLRAAPAWLRSPLTRIVVAAIAVAVVLPLALVMGEGIGFAPLARLAPLLHPKDQANLPIVRAIIDAHMVAITVGLATVLGALAAALGALRRARWTRLFVASAALATALWVLVFALFQPALARARTFAPFLAEVRTRIDGHPLYFYPGTFDFGAAFYAPSDTRHWRPGVGHGPGPHYVLVWDDAVASVRGRAGAPEVLAISAGTEPKGRRHLALVRLP